MKKIFFLAVALSGLSAISFAQASFGVQIGGNVGFTQAQNGTFSDYSNKPRIGILAGFLAEVPMGPVSFRPEINFIQKGWRNEARYSNSFVTVDSNSKVRLNYVEVPLNFVYNFGSTNKFFIGVGPNFALGLSGKQEFERTINTGVSTDVVKDSKLDVKFSGDNAAPGTLYLKRFDFGANALVGFRSAMGLMFSLGYTVGIADISRNLAANDDFTRRNHGGQLKIGYMFGGNRPTGGGTTVTPTSTGSLIQF